VRNRRWPSHTSLLRHDGEYQMGRKVKAESRKPKVEG